MIDLLRKTVSNHSRIWLGQWRTTPVRFPCAIFIIYYFIRLFILLIITALLWHESLFFKLMIFRWRKHISILKSWKQWNIYFFYFFNQYMTLTYHISIPIVTIRCSMYKRKMAIRKITSFPFCYTPFFKHLSILKLKDLYALQILQF